MWWWCFFGDLGFFVSHLLLFLFDVFLLLQWHPCITLVCAKMVLLFSSVDVKPAAAAVITVAVVAAAVVAVHKQASFREMQVNRIKIFNF